MSTVKLNNGYDFPMIGLGTFTKDVSQVKSTIMKSLEIGFKHIDTASFYSNEQEIGKGLKEAFEKKIVKREDVFVVTKLWSTKHRKEDVKSSLQGSLKLLQLDYLDLFLIHWPMSFKCGGDGVPVDQDGNALFEEVSYLETWKGMEECVRGGLVRSIGLSNFNSLQILDILKHCTIKPSVLQVEVHPYLQQHKLHAFCIQHNIVLTAYSPLGSPARPWVDEKEVGMLEDAVMVRVAERRSRKPAQVALRWLLQRGIVAIPKSSNSDRLKLNFSVFDFELTDEDMKDIEGMDKGLRYCTPAHFHPGKADWPKVAKYPFNAEF